MNKTLEYKIIKLIKLGIPSYQICEILKIDNKTYKQALKQMRIDAEYERCYRTFKENSNNPPYKVKTGNTKTFGFISDLHLGSMYDASDIIESIYDACEERNVTALFCCGDVVNGPESFRYFNFEDTAEMVASTIPERKGIKLYTISGNHDESASEDEKENILERVSDLRDDIVFLGEEVADITVNRITMRLCHGTFKTFNDVESRINTIYGELTKSYVPDVLALGHIHKSGYEEIGGCHILQCASLEEGILAKDRFYVTPERSMWFLHVRYDKNGIPLEYTPELVTFPSRDKDIMQRKIQNRHGKRVKK